MSAIGRDPQAEFRAQKKQVRIEGIFGDHVGIAVNVILPHRQRIPGFPVVRSFVDVGLDVAKRVTVKRRIRRTFREAAGRDGRNPRVFGQIGNIAHYVGPGFGAIARDLQIAVVGAHPDNLAIFRRFRDGVDRGVHLGRGIVNRHATGFLLLLLFGIVGGEIGGDTLPGLAVIAGTEKELRADVDGSLFVGAHVNRRVPVEV